MIAQDSTIAKNATVVLLDRERTVCCPPHHWLCSGGDNWACVRCEESMPAWRGSNRLNNSAYGTHYEDTPRKAIDLTPAKSAPLPKPVCAPAPRHNMHQHPGKSGYFGVTAWKNGWKARICVDRRQMHLGVFATPEAAAMAYNAVALKHFGRIARLNQLRLETDNA